MTLPTLILAVALAAPPSESEIAGWIAALGDARYSVREQAQQKLWQAGPAAESAVRRAAAGSDPETVRRARRLVEQYDWGVYASTPPAVVAQIARFRGGDDEARQQALRELVRLGEPGWPTLGRIAARTTQPVEKAFIGDTIANAVRDQLPNYLKNRDFPAAERLLLACLEADTGLTLDHYVAVLLMSGRLAEARADWAARLARGDAPAVDVAFALARAAGDHAAARKIADDSRRPELIEQALWDASDWAALAKLDPVAGADRPQSQAYATALKAYCVRRAGDPAAARKLLDDLAKQEQTPDGLHDRLVAAQALLLLERPDDAVTLLTSLGQRAFAFDVRFARGEYTAALALGERPVTEEVASRQSGARLPIARTLALLGKTEAAREQFAALASEATAPVDATAVAELVKAMSGFGMADDARKVVGQYLDTIDHQAVTEGIDLTATVLTALVPKNGEAAAAWYRFWRERQPGESGADRVGRVLAIFAPGSAAGELSDADIAAFSATIPEEPVGAFARGRQALGAALIASGRVDAGRAEYRRAAERANLAPTWLKLGDAERAVRRPADAADAFARAAQRAPNRPLILYLQAASLREAGRAAEAAELADQAFRVSGGEFSSRAELASDLRRRGLFAEARREEQFILQAIGERASYAVNALDHAARDAAAAGDHARAAELAERMIGDVLRFGLSFVDQSGSLVASHRVRLLRARAAIDAGDAALALDHARAAQALLPRDIGVPQHVGRGLRRLGKNAEADALYDRAAGLYRAALAEFPDSPLLNNDAAWCAACCRRDLDAAVEWARKATKISPQSSGYFDTLAEVHHQRGERPAALAAIRAAIALDPASPYLRGQLRRIENQDRDTAPAEPDE